MSVSLSKTGSLWEITKWCRWLYYAVYDSADSFLSDCESSRYRAYAVVTGKALIINSGFQGH